MKQRSKRYFIDLIASSCWFGAITGILTAVAITFFKVCTGFVISVSETGYAYLREHLVWLPVVIGALFGISLLLAYYHRRYPDLRGGGIPTSIGILRGILSFHWLKNLIGTFALSLVSFLIGVPLGNEGPSVLIGTAIGRGTVFSLTKKHRAWDRYAMTGGACAGFSVATGAPISGILFAIEEAHQRISPMILLISAFSVLFARITTELLAPLCGVSVSLFPKLQLTALSIEDIWIPLVVGVTVGLCSVLFLKYFRLLNTLFRKALNKVHRAPRIFIILLLTLGFGLCSFSFISTGHDLIVSLFEGDIALYLLVLILIVRTTLTLSANTTGITGGVFVPILALGAVISAILGKVIASVFGLSAEQYALVLVLGITACIAGMMKMPLTAIIFSLEALSCSENILSVIIVAAAAFAITEIFGVRSINENALEHKTEQLNASKTAEVIDTFVTVQADAFAIGKQIRDIFWPANLFVLSVRHDPDRGAQVDEHGEKIIHEGDILHVRYSTFDESQTKAELTAIVGDQSYAETKTDII